VHARDVPDAGLCWPFKWLNNAEDYIQDRWSKFMDGQTYCDAGFYERDVRRFLFSIDWKGEIPDEEEFPSREEYPETD
jgi:hypothetical protein